VIETVNRIRIRIRTIRWWRNWWQTEPEETDGAGWGRKSLVRQVEAAAVIQTARDWEGKGQRPFANLCLTTWLIAPEEG
jgi:hypothetical protein